MTLLSDWISTAFAPELTIQPNKCGHELFQRIFNLIFDYYSTATSVLTILHPLSHDKGITKSLDVARTQKNVTGLTTSINHVQTGFYVTD